MKNISVAFALFAISALINKAAAQSTTVNIQSISTSGANTKNESGTDVVNVHAMKDFEKTFHCAKNATWINTVDGGYIVRLTVDSIKTTVAYNHKGIWQYTLRYYKEKELPQTIRSTVKNAYCGYDVLGAIGVFVEENVYQVYVQNENNEKLILVDDDENLSEIDSFKRE